MSSKLDEIIIQFAIQTIQECHQVLSFDLPDHGDRKDERRFCAVQFCIKDLTAIMKYSRIWWNQISLFTCSKGVYFSFTGL